tara:strand:+ start:1907 stop:2197 length:291 start_codon:yes stop_codon:yes gene_type:complete
MESINVFNSIRYRITPSRNNSGYNAMDGVSKYSVSWTNVAGDNIYADMHSVGPYTYAKILEGQGSTNIKIYFRGNLIDHYVQGRSTRNISSLQATE